MYLVFDIGGTRMRFGITKDGNQIDDYKVVDTPANYSTALKVIAQVIDALAPRTKFEAAAGGLPGPLSPLRDRFLRLPHLPNWEDKPILQDLTSITMSPVYLENDTAVVGLGEALYGAGQDTAIAAYITISTGIGGVRIVNGRLDEAYFGFEPGHHILNWQPSRKLEELSSWEEHISGSAIKKKYNVEPHNLQQSEFWEQAHEEIAVALHNLNCFWSPQVVILGGGLVNAKLINLLKVQQYWRRIPTVFPELPQLKVAELGTVGGLYGALALLKYKHLKE